MTAEHSDLSSNEASRLPAWLADLLPERSPSIKASVSEDRRSITIYYPEGRMGEVDSLKALDELTRGSEFDLTVDDEVGEVFGNRGMLFYPIEGSDFHGIVIGMDDDDRLAVLQDDYADSLKYIDKFVKDPSFRNAWRMVDSHPAFWTAPDIKKSPWSWRTSGHCSTLRMNVFSKEGKDVVTVETGSHVERDGQSGEPSYRSHYGDWRLEVAGATYEEAIITLAERVVLCFNSDGSDKPEDEIDLMKPAWVVELEETLADRDKDSEVAGN